MDTIPTSAIGTGPDGMLTTREAAQALGLSVQRVRQLVYDGRLRARIVGRDLFYSPTDLEAVRVRRPRGRPKPQAPVQTTLPTCA